MRERAAKASHRGQRISHRGRRISQRNATIRWLGGDGRKRALLANRGRRTPSPPAVGGETPPDFVRARRPVTGGSSHVAQVGNLLFRRRAVGRPAGCQPATQQTASLRYVAVTGQGGGVQGHQREEHPSPQPSSRSCVAGRGRSRTAIVSSPSDRFLNRNRNPDRNRKNPGGLGLRSGLRLGRLPEPGTLRLDSMPVERSRSRCADAPVRHEPPPHRAAISSASRVRRARVPSGGGWPWH
jgi:hypothetical protein